MQNYILRIWDAQANSIICGHKLYLRKIWKLLQAIWHILCSIIIVHPSEQWTSRSTHKICKENHEKMVWNKCLPLHVFLQMKLTLISPRLPSLYILFNRPSRGILLSFSRWATRCNNDDGNHSSLINRQLQRSEDVDTCKNIPLLPARSTVAAQWEDRGTWTHGIVVGHETDDHKDMRYKAQVTKTGHITTWTKCYVREWQLSVNFFISV